MSILKHSFSFNERKISWIKPWLLQSSKDSRYPKVMMNISDETRDQLELASRIREAISSQPRGIKSRISTKCNVSPQAVTGWEKTGKIEKDNLAIVSDETGYSLRWLITGKGEKFAAMHDTNVMELLGSSSQTENNIESTADTYRQLIPVSRKLLPVLNAEQAKNWKEAIDTIQLGTDNGMIDTSDLPITPYMFLFRVVGDANSPEFIDGEVAYIDPELEPEIGKPVLVDIAGDVVIRKLWREAGEMLLAPYNTKYDPKPLKDAKIIGVVAHATPIVKARTYV